MTSKQTTTKFTALQKQLARLENGARLQGYTAYREGLRCGQNPYSEGPRALRDAWGIGWREGMREQAPRKGVVVPEPTNLNDASLEDLHLSGVLHIRKEPFGDFQGGDPEGSCSEAIFTENLNTRGRLKVLFNRFE